MPEVRVQPRSVYEHHVIISKPNTTLNWSFSTKKKSICFGLYCRYGLQSKKSSSTRASFDDSQVEVKKRNLSLKTTQMENSTTTTADEVQQHYYSGTGYGAAVTSPSKSIPRERHSMTAATIKDTSSSIQTQNRRKSTSAISITNLLDNGFTELIPIDQVNSSKEVIEGSYLAQEPGNYVLIFDNMFSRNTSKLLDFTVTSDEPNDEGLDEDECDLSGWLLKKKRKRMQGWAKRWFELSPTGVLSYSVRKGDIKRGSLQILLATIALSPKQLTIHIDSGTTIFHLRALSSESFEKWLNCIRSKRNDSNNVMWNGDLTDGVQSAISLIPDTNGNEISHRIIARGLSNMENEIKQLNTLITEDLTPLLTSRVSPSNTSPTINLSLPTSPTSRTSNIKLKFPFKRGTSFTNLEEHQSTSTTNTDPSSIIMEKISQSLVLLTNYRNQVSNAYFENYDSKFSGEEHPLEIPSRTGTGFLSHRTASFYSYSANSDQFFDAEEILMTNEDNESTYGSIDADSEDEEPVSSLSTNATAILSESQPNGVSRRSRLPHPIAVRTISVLGILRKNIGKDLSTVSLPISLNEPLNLLQRLCEELESSELLDKATRLSSSLDRLIYVTVFAISGYSATQYRVGRKPCNPLLCETFECVRPDKGFRFISEKVSHHPNIMACHADSPNFQYRQTYLGKTKFWGKSLELITEGQTHITLSGHPDQYTYSRPSSWLRNLVTGTRYLEHLGEMRVNNHHSGEYAIVTFKEASAGGGNSFFSNASNINDRNNVSCKFYSSQNLLLREVEGKWSDSLSEITGADQYSVLWRTKPPTIPDYQDYYGFTQFAMELNEITSVEKDKLPMTDSRYRPDQRLFEDGRVAEAEEEKNRVEQFQRERRKQYQLKGQTWSPLWFEMKPDKYSTAGQSWQYKGGYWEARDLGQWPNEMLQLW